MGTWEPDSCGNPQGENCLIELRSDGTWNFERFLRICSDHQQIATDQERWDIVTSENSRGIGNTIFTTLENAPAAFYDIDAQSGSRTFKRDITINWSWSGVIPNRVLTFEIIGRTLTQNQRNAIQSKLDQRFGIGKTVLA